MFIDSLSEYVLYFDENTLCNNSLGYLLGYDPTSMSDYSRAYLSKPTIKKCIRYGKRYNIKCGSRDDRGTLKRHIDLIEDPLYMLSNAKFIRRIFLMQNDAICYLNTISGRWLQSHTNFTEKEIKELTCNTRFAIEECVIDFVNNLYYSGKRMFSLLDLDDEIYYLGIYR